MKQSQLRSDPAKVRAFVDRNRQSLERTTGLKRETPLRSATGFGPMVPESIADAVSARFTPFKARRPARVQTCERCRGRPAAHWHHWVAQEHLRVMMRGLAVVMAFTPVETQRRLRVWLRDERNLTPMCSDCHLSGEQAGSGRFLRREVPSSAFDEFVDDVDAELEAAGRPREAMVRLLRSYPAAIGEGSWD